MQETQRAKTAYAEYLAMGPGRSLEKLLAEYQERKRTGKGASVPTTRYATLADWSRKHGWQARVAAFEGKQNEAIIARSMDDIEKARQENLKLTQAGKMLVAKSMKEGTFRGNNHQALIELVKLEMALMGAPLAEKLEHSGPGGGPLEVAVEHDLSDGLTTPERLASVAGILSSLGLLVGGDADEAPDSTEAAAD
jgi:hypothetical protein